MSKSSKGASWERAIADQLSLWWTQDETTPRTDIFWRSSNSGGRATVRKRKGESTSNQYGDTSATDPIGIPFLQVATTELKRGYSTDTVADLLDCSPSSAQQVYESWFEKVIRSHKHSNSFAWMLLVKRDRRDAFCFIPGRLWAALREVGAMKKLPYPFFSLTCVIRLKEDKEKTEIEENIIGMKFNSFLEGTKPKQILEISSNIKENKNNDLPKLSEKSLGIK